MWRWYTAEDRRQAAAVVLLLIVVGLILVAISPLLAGVLMIMMDQSALPTLVLANGPAIVIDLWRAPVDPAIAFGVPRMSPVILWSLTGVIMVVIIVGYVWFARMTYQMIAPTGTGFAGHADIARDLSVSACRKRARVTRPDLDPKARRAAAAAQLGIPLHQAPVSRAQLWLPLENATGVIAPQQSGKTLMDLLHKVIAAPGGLITTSTKLDLFLLTAHARERGGSDVHVLDLTGAATWPRKVHWNPVRGCITVKAAKRRAQALLRATTGDASEGLGNHAFFERRAVDVMTAYLLAAGLSRASLPEFVGWCQNDLDTEAASVLRSYPAFAAVRRTLQQAQAVVEETRSGIWETLRDAIACLTDPEVADSALPRPGEPSFDPETFVETGGTIYVIGSEDDAATQSPLITAFVQEVLDCARRRAISCSQRSGYERLAPPFTAVLDEVASICPLA